MFIGFKTRFASKFWIASSLFPLVVLTGCVSSADRTILVEVLPIRSPKPEVAPVSQAWQLAENYAASQPNAEAFFGCGDSMSPLYTDHTIIVVEKQSPDKLESGMTVVFVNDLNHRVAHTLIKKTSRGWAVAGLSNGYLDSTFVTDSNYVGTITRAWKPTYISDI